jgi:hypothetical protein
MGLITMLALSMGMMVTLGQFQEAPAADWVKLAQAMTDQFKFDNITVRVDLHSAGPLKMKIAYVTKANSGFDSSAQNVEMENVAKFATEHYKGRDLTKIDQVEVTRSEIHGKGCFQTTYVATFTLDNPKKRMRGFPQTPPQPPPEQEQEK